MIKNEEIPPTLADYKAWLIKKYPKRKWMLDIRPDVYRILVENQRKKLERDNNEGSSVEQI
jgi:predicted DNA-binding protein (UPF0278 family)